MASAAWERRNAAARSRGYRDYYDYRAHDYGKIPPSQPAASGERLALLRGHRGAADMQAAMDTGRVAMVLVNPTERDAMERWRIVEITLVMKDGTTRLYRVRQKDLNADTMGALADAAAAGGVPVADRYDVLGWALEHDVEDDYWGEDYDEAA